ncbi:Ku protein [Streptomyces sp. NPDC059278]|uniref:Ku protein n=1 Tax=Streptomyces sp. NPDC059278 TaxID=3346801 RepID=UPI0036C2E74D
MAGPVWKGIVSFGLVSLPVALYTATDSHTIRFHQLQRGTAGIATFVMRGREYLVALKAEDGLLTLHTLHWADQIRGPHEEVPTCRGRRSRPRPR